MKKIAYVVIALMVIASFTLAGCKQEAALGTEENPIIWALVPSGETDTVLAGFEDVAAILYDETGLVIEPFVATEYAGVIEALSADPPKAHMASLATFAYLVASARGVADVALVSERYGSPSYNGQIITRADSGINDIADLAGKTYCRPDPLSTSGWIIPMVTMQAAGINPETDLAEVVDAGSHDAVAAGVYDGTCDAGSTYIDVRSSMEEDYPDIMEVTKVINVSVDIPNDGVQFSPSVPAEIREAIVNALLTINETEEGLAAIDAAYEWTKLVAKDDSFYDPFRQVLDAAGIDPETLMGE
ncbi:phosphate/phosphite/phosphonate ABC transporter substrate-binding protein (plasmid) [Chloroflexota bacterium]|nr:phosphate/phosphite/phosphonate ABC transporter substrate-binding protein [Chloroflexota bacterium]